MLSRASWLARRGERRDELPAGPSSARRKTMNWKAPIERRTWTLEALDRASGELPSEAEPRRRGWATPRRDSTVPVRSLQVKEATVVRDGHGAHGGGGGSPARSRPCTRRCDRRWCR